MHRNTFIFVIFLGIFAALVVAANLYQRSPSSSSSIPSPTSSPDTPTPSLLSYIDQRCTISFQYPSFLTAIPLNPSGATFVRTGTSETIFSLTCGNGLQPPDSESFRNETQQIGSISATLYFDGPEATQSSELSIYLRNKATNMSILLAGDISIVQQILETIRFL